ncbi:hypothetical protein OAS39_05945 [Pirellulales bacterium]|nr:hypothetical protein [Pirellulales bacterium]
MKRNAILSWLCTFGMLVLASSCGTGVSPPDRPSIDSAAAAAEAIKLFDVNSDRQLDGNELNKSPGLADGKVRIDANGDGLLSEDEIAQRIESWSNSPRRLVTVPLQFSLKNRLLRGAKVTVEPEPFLKEWLPSVSGETDNTGSFTPVISRQLPGMHLGFYRVIVSLESRGKQIIPERYNSQTELGVEFCGDRPVNDQFVIPFKLNGKR